MQRLQPRIPPPWVGNPTITAAAMQAACAAVHPNVPAIIGESGPLLSHAQLAAQTVAIRSDLRRLGIGQGDRVGAVLGLGPASATLAFGLAAACVVVPLPSDLPDDEAAALLARLRLAAPVVPPDGDGATAAAAAPRRDVPTLRFSTPDSRGLAAVTGDPVGPSAPDAPPTLDDWAMILCASGTTGRPKLVPRSHRALALTTEQLRSRVRMLSPGDTTMLLAPLPHSPGIHLLIPTLCCGASLVCPGRPRADHVVGLVARHDPPSLTVAPPLLADLAARAGAGVRARESSGSRRWGAATRSRPPTPGHPRH